MNKGKLLEDGNPAELLDETIQDVTQAPPPDPDPAPPVTTPTTSSGKPLMNIILAMAALIIVAAVGHALYTRYAASREKVAPPPPTVFQADAVADTPLYQRYKDETTTPSKSGLGSKENP